MALTGTVTGWKLPRAERERLLQRFAPKYENVIADHVTLRTGATPQTPLPRKPDARVVGRADDGRSLECLVVELDGTTGRPDGSAITSPGRWGRRARRARATTCFASVDGNALMHRFPSSSYRRGSDG